MDGKKFSRVVDESRRRERDAAVERARRGEAGFSEVRGDLIEAGGVPDHIREYEVGAGFMVGSPEDHPEQN